MVQLISCRSGLAWGKSRRERGGEDGVVEDDGRVAPYLQEGGKKQGGGSGEAFDS